MSETLIKVEGVSKKFCRSLKKSLWYGLQDVGNELRGRRHGGDGDLRAGEFWAVKDISFDLKRGECLGLIGRNGVGKTTLLRMLNGLIKPDRGRIEMRGRVGALIALGAGFNPILTGRENVYVNAAVLGLSREETDAKFDEILDFADLAEFIDSPVQNYSSGMAVRLGFAIAAKTNPDILLLDEVLTVGDVGFQAKCFNTLAQFRDQGTAFILVSHNMHQISRYADRLLYLKSGVSAQAIADDAERGIATYLADMRQCDSVDEINWSEINGSGKLTFESAQFLDATEKEVKEIDVGDSITLQLSYRIRDASIDPIVIEVLARDREGVAFQVRKPWDTEYTETTLQAKTIRMTIASIPVNSGYLDFYFCALSARTGELYDWKRNLRLRIRPDYSSISRIALPIRWD
jgi:lipopolysaccharide transport system ATP-binding protein